MILQQLLNVTIKPKVNKIGSKLAVLNKTTKTQFKNCLHCFFLSNLIKLNINLDGIN